MRSDNSMPAATRLFYTLLLSLLLGCGGGEEKTQEVKSFALAIIKSQEMAGPTEFPQAAPSYRLKEVQDVIRSSGLSEPLDIYRAAQAAQISAAQIDALFNLPTGSAVEYITKNRLAQLQGGASIIGLSTPAPVYETASVQQLISESRLYSDSQLYDYAKAAQLSSDKLDTVFGLSPGSAARLVQAKGWAPLTGTARLAYNKSIAEIPFSVAEIPDLIRKKGGWPKAQRNLEHWFEGSGDNFFIEMNEIISLLPDVEETLNKWKSIDRSFFISGGTVLGGEVEFRSSAYKFLLQVLRQPMVNGRPALLTGRPVLLTGGDFDHIAIEIPAAGLGWQDYEWEKQNMFWIEEKIISKFPLNGNVTDFHAAYGDAALRMLAKGRVDVKQSGKASITITDIGFYFKDSFDFIGSQPLRLGLGCWSRSDPYFRASSPVISGTTLNPFAGDGFHCIDNVDFRNFNADPANAQRKGKDFRIFSKPITYKLPKPVELSYQLSEDEIKQRNAYIPESPAPVVSGFYVNNTTNTTIAGGFSISDADSDNVQYLRVHISKSSGGSECTIDVGGVYGSVQATGSKSFSSAGCASMMNASGTYFAKVEAYDTKGSQAAVVNTSFTRR